LTTQAPPLSLDALTRELADLPTVDALQKLTNLFPGQVVFSTSLGYEDQVITDLIYTNKLPISIFTLDTGRLFGETYSVWQKTNSRYGQPIEAYHPRTDSVESLLTGKGPFSFYDSVENRKECCFIRKVEPLRRALAGQRVWITGIRAEQSTNRQTMSSLEWDDAHQLIKFHPILDWSLTQVTDYIRANNVPYNPLHDRGFVSIGCQPCTRAVQPGEDFRAGRWWWEGEAKKECGLHENQQSTK
jgi:phosphoadenosine phosphosulfate reductase